VADPDECTLAPAAPLQPPSRVGCAEGFPLRFHPAAPERHRISPRRHHPCHGQPPSPSRDHRGDAGSLTALRLRPLHRLRRLATDAELRFAGNGNPVTRCVLRLNDRTGQAHYLDVVVFGEGAKTLAQYGAKGRRLVMYGRISTRTWDAEEAGHRKSVDLIADDFHFADRAPAPPTE